MDMKLCILASGSKGNCTYIKAGKARILVDIGISVTQVIAKLKQIGVDPVDITAIFITHEHDDHIKGVGFFSRKFGTPIYATQKTWDVILAKELMGKVTNIKIIDVAVPVLIANVLRIKAFSISHDTVDPVGYVFNTTTKKIGYLTDCGTIDQNIVSELSDCNGIVLEFNHELNLLEVGKYPYFLKKRIASNIGHLSNDDAAKLLLDVYHKNLKWAILAHISEENNVPELAYLSAKNILKGNNKNSDIQLYIAQQKKPSAILTI